MTVSSHTPVFWKIRSGPGSHERRGSHLRFQGPLVTKETALLILPLPTARVSVLGADVRAAVRHAPRAPGLAPCAAARAAPHRPLPVLCPFLPSVSAPAVITDWGGSPHVTLLVCPSDPQWSELLILPSSTQTAPSRDDLLPLPGHVLPAPAGGTCS